MLSHMIMTTSVYAVSVVGYRCFVPSERLGLEFWQEQTHWRWSGRVHRAGINDWQLFCQLNWTPTSGPWCPVWLAGLI